MGKKPGIDTMRSAVCLCLFGSRTDNEIKKKKQVGLKWVFEEGTTRVQMTDKGGLDEDGVEEGGRRL